MRFSPYDMHVETFPTSAWSDTEKICVVSHLYFSFLAGDVDADWKSLTVCVVGRQRSILRCFQMLLEEKTQGGIGQG